MLSCGSGDLFALGPEESPTLYFNGKKAVKTSDVSRIAGKTFKETKSAGYKKLKHRAVDSYAGLTERQIRHVTSNNSASMVEILGGKGLMCLPKNSKQ